jgi:hypothetical protein
VGEDPGEHNEARVAPNSSLWSCKVDGTALRRLTYNLSNDMDPAILPDGRMIYAGWLRPSRSPQSDGRVSLLGVNTDGTDYQRYAGDEGLRVKQMPTPAADDGSGRLASVSQRRPLHTHRSLSGNSDGYYRAPAPLPDGRLLVSWRSGPRDLFGVHVLDLSTGARERLVQQNGWHSVQAKAIAARTVPDARSSVVRDDDPEGRIYTIDVNIHDLGSSLPEATARAVRIVEGLPATADRPVIRRILGETPLAGDGSYQAQIPANTPIQLQLLDSDGLAIRSSAWLWVRNHAVQGCVGCHEDPERVPPNRLMQALGQPAPVLHPPPDRRRSVTSGDLAPILASRCLGCHGPGGQRPRLDEGADALTPYITRGEARRSPLVWHLLGRPTVRPWDPEAGSAAAKPIPASASALTAAELRTFLEWIDLGGPP